MLNLANMVNGIQQTTADENLKEERSKKKIALHSGSKAIDKFRIGATKISLRKEAPVEKPCIEDPLFFPGHLHDDLPFFRFNGANRQTAQANQVHIGQALVCFNGCQTHGLL